MKGGVGVRGDERGDGFGGGGALGFVVPVKV